MPASTPVATGSAATSSAGNEAKASSSKVLISPVPAMASQCTSRWICARLSTPNTGAPLTFNVRPWMGRLLKADRTAAIDSICASRSAPGALLMATSSALAFC